jgi:hypothetical protein
MMMKTTILAAIAALSLGVGVAYASGAPVGYEVPNYGHFNAYDGPATAADTSAKGG